MADQRNPAEDVLVPINFGGGLDTKADPKLVMPAKFLMLKDGIFTRAKQVAKRNGYDAMTLATNLGSITNPLMVASYKDELICAAADPTGRNQLFSYSTDLASWIAKGQYDSIASSKSVVAPGDEDSAVNCSSVVIGNLALYVYDGSYTAGYGGTASNGTFYKVVDLTTGTQIGQRRSIQDVSMFSKAAVIGSNTFAIFYVQYVSGTHGKISAVTITVGANGNITESLPVQFGDNLCNLVTNQFPFCFDVVSTSTGCILASANANASPKRIDLYSINSSLSIVSNTSITTTGYAQPLTLALTPADSTVWLYWYDTSTTKVAYAIFSQDLSSLILGSHNITSALAVPAQQLAAIYIGGTEQSLYISQYQLNGAAAATYYPTIVSYLCLENGTSSITGNGSGVDIYAKPFVNPQNSRIYMPCVSISQEFCTGVILDLTGVSGIGIIGVAVAKFLTGSAEGIYTAGFGTVGGTLVAPTFIGTRYPGFIGVVSILSNTMFILAAGFVNKLNQGALALTDNESAFPSLETISVNMGAASVLFDFNHEDAYQAVVQQDTLALNGSIMKIYDGEQVVDMGFVLPPDNIAAQPSTSGGAQAAGTYIYYVTYTFLDANGNQYESEPSPPLEAVFTSGSTNSVMLYIPTGNVSHTGTINIYRSDSNLGGNIAYLSGRIVATSPQVTFTDTQPSSTTTNVTLYTENGAILDNTAPPPAMVMWTNNNRLWVVDSENPETNIEYSKTGSKGYGILFSVGLLELVIDSKAAAITGASPMDEKTVILKENGLGYFIGDGANDAGQGSTITQFQFVPSDVGCTNSKSVILYPGGIIFRTTKGIYELSRGMVVQYFGMEVEAYNAQDIQSALIVPSRNQIRFLTSSGFSLLYDYVMKQWSVFTNHQGLSATNWQGQYIYARVDGLIYEEDPSSFQDNGQSYSLILQTAWLPISSVQNFQRVKQLLSLGDFQNGGSSGHGVQVQAAYDFNQSYLSGVPYLFGTSSSSGVFQYRNFFSRQKCDTISLLISEITTGASGESMDLTNMSFIASIKRGGNKLSPKASVG